MTPRNLQRPRSPLSRWLFSAVLAAGILALRPRPSRADPPAAPAAASTAGAGEAPDESLLGTVEVNGSAGGLLPLPKMAVVPIVTEGSADSVVNLVVRRDMTLSGQFEVLDPSAAPSGPFTHTTPVDLAAFRSHGAEYVLRVFAQPAANDSAKTELVGEAYLAPAPGVPGQGGAQRPVIAGGASVEGRGTTEPRPAFRTVVPTSTVEVRAASHRLVDQLLGALTGRPGGFASEMAYAEKVGRWRRVYALDSDGFDLRALGPIDATALSPAFGPGGQIFYALSRDYSPFQLVFGPNAALVPISIPGSILGLAFDGDRSHVALVAMDGGRSQLWMGDRGRLRPMETPPFANHPVFGPLGKIAYAAGTPVQRVYVDGKPISPPGFMASAPVFCDTPQGLLVVYTVGTGAGADIIATDANGGSLRRLTQHEGANTYAACSPDGRLIAFFSTGKRKVDARGNEDGGGGLFVMPVQRPWLARKVSDEVGESLRWEPL
ncbi:MAG: tolB protein [Myxococcota bacterium]|nr:tolB protein [Myxococcota bacterium]